MKHGIDALGSALGLVLLAPVWLVAAALIWLTLGRPVLFSQLRPGRNGDPFVLYKLRTMREAQETEGNPLPDGERLPAVGRFLRDTSLDELPELWNVLKGDMSLVGPRPLLIEYLPLYTREQARRHEVKPGITGWAQVNGRNAISWEQKFTYDTWYVDNWSIWLDLKILWLTVVKVLKREGIRAPGHATMSRFDQEVKEKQQHS